MSAGTIVAYQVGDAIVLSDCDEYERPFRYFLISAESAIRIGELGHRALAAKKQPQRKESDNA